MIDHHSVSGRCARFLDRLHAQLAARGASAAGFVTPPEPRRIGSVARGRQLLAGDFLFAGHLLKAPGTSPWDLDAPDPAFARALHGFEWLDDLVAMGDGPARDAAATWLWGWIDRFGAGRGPGWTPDLAGRRLIRWINHAEILLRGQSDDRVHAFFRSLSRQTRFLARRWRGAADGLPRFEALTGLIQAGMVLDGLALLAEPAIPALARDCADQVDAGGGLPSRNPEELLEVLTLLTSAAAALAEAGRPVPHQQLEAIGRIVPCLRTLRHADGGLARFHGGGRGPEGRLDHALAASGEKGRMPDGLSMGFARLSAGRTSAIIDAGVPPGAAASHNAHASTLAFELTSGRRPVIVNCGSGAPFGPAWRRAGRATPSHSTLCLDGFSSARLGRADRATGRAPLTETPRHVPIGIGPAGEWLHFEGAHDGYVASHGLTHARTLEITLDGRELTGEDMLLALDATDMRRFDRMAGRREVGQREVGGIPFDIRFHLHPEVQAALDPDGPSVSLVLKSGEVWEFRGSGLALRLEASVYLDSTRLKPRATRQIVLSGRAMDHATRVRWTFAKPQQTGLALRDLVPDHLPMPQD